MPNKHSHRVVLAHYSTLGLVDLPHDTSLLEHAGLAYSAYASNAQRDLRRQSTSASSQAEGQHLSRKGEAKVRSWISSSPHDSLPIREPSNTERLQRKKRVRLSLVDQEDLDKIRAKQTAENEETPRFSESSQRELANPCLSKRESKLTDNQLSKPTNGLADQPKNRFGTTPRNERVKDTLAAAKKWDNDEATSSQGNWCLSKSRPESKLSKQYGPDSPPTPPHTGRSQPSPPLHRIERSSGNTDSVTTQVQNCPKAVPNRDGLAKNKLLTETASVENRSSAAVSNNRRLKRQQAIKEPQYALSSEDSQQHSAQDQRRAGRSRSPEGALQAHDDLEANTGRKSYKDIPRSAARESLRNSYISSYRPLSAFSATTATTDYASDTPLPTEANFEFDDSDLDPIHLPSQTSSTIRLPNSNSITTPSAPEIEFTSRPQTAKKKHRRAATEASLNARLDNQLASKDSSPNTNSTKNTSKPGPSQAYHEAVLSSQLSFSSLSSLSSLSSFIPSIGLPNQRAQNRPFQHASSAAMMSTHSLDTTHGPIGGGSVFSPSIFEGGLLQNNHNIYNCSNISLPSVLPTFNTSLYAPAENANPNTEAAADADTASITSSLFPPDIPKSRSPTTPTHPVTTARTLLSRGRFKSQEFLIPGPSRNGKVGGSKEDYNAKRRESEEMVRVIAEAEGKVRETNRNSGSMGRIGGRKLVKRILRRSG
ncbi:MAG: hypothetical protein Q9227_006574 [Pyrenula ochraceoflavens]